nr:unnamed protein product [Spirometra erinaceieuropaei]
MSELEVGEEKKEEEEEEEEGEEGEEEEQEEEGVRWMLCKSSITTNSFTRKSPYLLHLAVEHMVEIVSNYGRTDVSVALVHGSFNFIGHCV